MRSAQGAAASSTPSKCVGWAQLIDVVCVPEVAVAPGLPLDGRFEDEIAWLARCHANGATIATACSGAVLLAETGLLDGYEATTHWAYCDVLQKRHPRVRVHPHRERSFKRRFQQATGMAHLEDVHTVRLEAAEQLFESGDLPIEAIANEVGYEDAGFFSRLFKRQVTLTPAQYRRRFGAMRRALQSAGATRPDAVPR